MFGNQIVGVSVGERKFQGVSTLNQLEAYGLLRPTTLARLSKRSADPRQLEMKALRDIVQRTFVAARIKRAEVYSAYVEAVEIEGKPGGTPAITLWMRELGSVEDGVLVIPYRSAVTNQATTLIAVDGETQTEARFMLRDRVPESGEYPIAITIYHGHDEDFGQQILHDYNKFAKPIGASQLGAFSHTGAMSMAIEHAVKAAGLEMSDLNRNGARPQRNKGHVFAHQQLMHAVAGLVMKAQALTANGSRWFDALNSPTDGAIGDDTGERLTYIIKLAKDDDDARSAAPLVWQCVGVKSPKRGKVNWKSACAAYNNTKSGGRGGPRMPVSERLETIYAAL